jgi:hypothetical protein
MARKTTGSASTRSKKNTTSAQPATEQITAPVPRTEVPKNGNLGAMATVAPPVNLEEEIRRRAYELYLKRRATAGSGGGNQNQDWLVAEREILSRHSQDHHA